MMSSGVVGTSMAGSSLRMHLQQLRWSGFCRMSQHEPAWRRALHDVYRVLSLTFTATYIIQMCIYACQERNDMDKLARVMFLILCHITSITKQIVFFVDADRIDSMIADLNDPLYNQTDERHRALLVEAARSAGRFTRAFTGAAIAVCTLWGILPLMSYARGQPFEFAFWVYYKYSSPTEFMLTSLYSYYVLTLVGIGDTSMDALIATILKQCKVQLTILRINFENLTINAQSLSKITTTNETFEEVLNRVFLDCLTHYRKISEMIHLLQDIFGLAILVQFTIGGWILCMAAYKIDSLNVLSVEFASMTLFILCMLTELFLYCYYGNEVTVESDRVVESLYAMEWRHMPVRFRRSLIVVMERAKRPLRPVAGRVIPLSLDTFVKSDRVVESLYAMEWRHMPVRFRRSLIVVMERAKRPLRPVAGRVIPLSLDTFVKIIKSSYSFYAVLRQTK